MTELIGIGGKLQHGKDAVADYLVEQYGWSKIGMSDALAEALYTLNPLVPRLKILGGVVGHERYQKLFDRVGYVKAKKNPEVRRLLQVLGTEIGREMISESVWTDITVRKIREQEAKGVPGVIVTGIRFHNELEMIEGLEGDTWWVLRPSLITSDGAAHASENTVSASDFGQTVVNNGSLDDLYVKVDILVNSDLQE